MPAAKKSPKKKVATKKPINAKVTLFSSIRVSQYNALKAICFQEDRPLAEILREAIDQYLANKKKAR